jgi:hypothetical protein
VVAGLLVGLVGPACASTTPTAAPTAMLDLRALPDDPLRRNERLDSTQVRPAPEDRKSLTPVARQVETAVATAAAFLGMLFTKNPTVLLGASAPVDENLLFEKRYPRDPSKDDDEDDDEDAALQPVDASQLVPWVKLPNADSPPP